MRKNKQKANKRNKVRQEIYKMLLLGLKIGLLKRQPAATRQQMSELSNLFCSMGNFMFKRFANKVVLI